MYSKVTLSALVATAAAAASNTLTLPPACQTAITNVYEAKGPIIPDYLFWPLTNPCWSLSTTIDQDQYDSFTSEFDSWSSQHPDLVTAVENGCAPTTVDLPSCTETNSSLATSTVTPTGGKTSVSAPTPTKSGAGSSAAGSSGASSSGANPKATETPKATSKPNAASAAAAGILAAAFGVVVAL